MKGLIIRRGNLSDSAGIAMLINHEIRSGLAIWRYAERTDDDIQNMLSERIASESALYVAESDGQIVGWTSYGSFRAGEGYSRTMEHSVHITPSYQRQGIARELMSKLLSHADAAGVHSLIGAIEATNTASLTLHKNLGFEEVGRLPEVGWKFDQWLSLVLMQRINRASKSQIETQI